MNQRIAITGSSGTIGRNILNFTKIQSRLEHPFRKIQEELTHIPSLDTLLHLSSPTNLLQIEQKPVYSRELILNGTLNLLEAFRLANGERFIYASSAHVYSPSDGKINENSKFEPISIYGEIKRECEIMLGKNAPDTE